MATIGSLIVNLIANTSLFDSGLRKSQTSLKGFVSNISKTQHSMMNFAKGVMAAAGVAGLGALVKQTMDSIEATSQLSDRLGMTTEDLISLQYAARQSGMSTEEMNNSLEIFVRRIGEASSGGGSAAKTLRELGLSAQELAFNDPAENLKLIADKINQLPNAAAKGAVAFDLFGRKGKDMLNLLGKGSGGIEAMQRRAEELHITFNKLDAAKVIEANNKLKEVQDVLKGVAQTAVIEMAPAISAAADQFVIFVTSIKDMPGKVMSGIETTAMAFSYLANGIVVLVDDVKGLNAIYQILFGTTKEVLSGYETLKDIKKSLDELPSEKTAAFFADLKTNMQKTREEIEKASAVAKTSPKLTVDDIKTTENLQRMLDALELEYDLLKKTNKERQKTNELLRFRNELDKAYNIKLSGTLQGVGPQMQGWDKLTAAQQKAILLDQQFQGMQQKNEERATSFSAFTTKIQEYGDQATNVWSNLGDIGTNALDGMSGALTQMCITGKADFKGLAVSIMTDILQMMIKMMMMKAIMAAMGMGAAPTPGAGGVPAGSALGNVIENGRYFAFANGGVVNRKVLFPMANGNVGMMGEAGPEAIMPLSRGSGGRLGVAVDGQSQPQVNLKVVNVTDKRQTLDNMSGPDGEKVIINALKRNKGLVAGMLR